MKEVLFLAHRIPYPPDRGDKIRSFNIVQALSRFARVHVAAFADDAADAAHEAGLRCALGSNLASCLIVRRRRSKGISVLAGLATGRSASDAAFTSRPLHRHVDRVLGGNRIASIFAFSGQVGQYVPKKIGDIRFVMDFVDVDSAKFESYADAARGPMRWLYDREAKRLGYEESTLADRADASLFVTEAEAALFRTRSGGAKIAVHALENGVDLEYFDPQASYDTLPEPRARPLLVFSGQMDYAPNVQAVVHFARDVLPRIRASAPGARFAIVGRNPPVAVTALAAVDGVEVVGAVADMRPWLAAADVVVAPLLTARGLQNKVLEAMAMGRPVVASSAAFEGIDADPGLELIVADGAEATSDAVISLCRDAAFAGGIGRAARARMCARYAWDRQLASLPELVFG